MSDPSVWRKSLLTGAKVVVTLALFWLIASKIDLSDTATRLRGANLPELGLATALIFIQMAFNAERWRRLLRMDGVTLRWILAYRYYVEAMFFNQALPGAIGGDVMRVFRVRPICARLGQAVNSVIMDRLTGLIGLGVLVLIGLPILIDMTGDGSVSAGVAVATVLAAGIAGVVLILACARLAEHGPGGKLRGAAVRFARLFAYLISHPLEALPIVLLAVSTHILVVATAYFSAEAMNLGFGFLECLVVIPTTVLIATLPISMGGWGVREGVMAAGFTLIGGDAASAVALSIVIGLELLVVGLIGGAVWFIGGAIRPDEIALAEADKGE